MSIGGLALSLDEKGSLYGKVGGWVGGTYLTNGVRVADSQSLELCRVGGWVGEKKRVDRQKRRKTDHPLTYIRRKLGSEALELTQGRTNVHL